MKTLKTSKTSKTSKTPKKRQVKTDLQTQTNNRPRKRLTPRRLPEKLWRIRSAGNLTQAEMLCAVNESETPNNRARVSQYETGKRAPSLVETVNYALYADVPLELLLDDEKELPARLRPAANRKTETRRPSHGKTPSPVKAKSNESATSDDDNRIVNAKAGDSIPDKKEEPTKPVESVELIELLAPTNHSSLPAAAEKGILTADVNRSDTLNLTEAYRMIFSAAIMKKCRTVYGELTAEIPFEYQWKFSTSKFIELMLEVALNDYEARGAESGIAYRVRELLEKQTRIKK